MGIEKTNYNKVIEVDDFVIYANDKQYFLFEHYPSSDGGYYAIPIGLGSTGKKVHQTMSNLYDWNYRYWHGESEIITKWGEQLDNLPKIG